ncbi:MAG: phosphate ABC transporter substrate-binding protein [Candidatus Cloacimonadia bacterium]
MQTKKVLIITSALLLIGVQLFGMSQQPKGEQLTLTGSTTVLPIAQKAAEDFMKMNPNANISVRGGGSGVGIAALIDGTTDIANASRPMKAKEIETAKEKGITPNEIVVSKDGIAVIVNPENPITGITLQQLKAIYTGKISDWRELGGEPGKIVVVSRDVASGTFEVFNEKVLEGEKVRNDALMLASNKAVATTVAQTPGAIGYVGMGYLSSDVKAPPVDGIYPTKANVVSGDYSLTRSLFMYTNGEPQGLAKEFIDFILSPAGQKIVEEQGFVSIK